MIVNKTEGRFVVANRKIVEDMNLSMKDRGLLLTLISLPPVWNFTTAGIASILPDGYDAVNAALNRLIEAGYVRRKQSRKGGKFSDMELEVYDTPCRDFTQTDNPLTEKTIAKKPITENPKQLNTNISNTEELNNNKSTKKGCAVGTEKEDRNGRNKKQGNRSDIKTNCWSDAERDLYGL